MLLQKLRVHLEQGPWVIGWQLQPQVFIRGTAAPLSRHERAAVVPNPSLGEGREHRTQEISTIPGEPGHEFIALRCVAFIALRCRTPPKVAPGKATQ